MGDASAQATRSARDAYGTTDGEPAAEEIEEPPAESDDDLTQRDTAVLGEPPQSQPQEDLPESWPPSQFEAGFVSLAHDTRALERTSEAARIAFAALD